MLYTDESNGHFIHSVCPQISKEYSPNSLPAWKRCKYWRTSCHTPTTVSSSLFRNASLTAACSTVGSSIPVSLFLFLRFLCCADVEGTFFRSPVFWYCAVQSKNKRWSHAQRSVRRNENEGEYRICRINKRSFVIIRMRIDHAAKYFLTRRLYPARYIWFTRRNPFDWWIWKTCALLPHSSSVSQSNFETLASMALYHL